MTTMDGPQTAEITTPLDQIIQEKIFHAQRKGRGFVLDLAESAGLIPALAVATIAIAAGTTVEGGTGVGSPMASPVVGTNPTITPVSVTAAAPKGLSIAVHETLPPVDEYEAKAKWRQHRIQDTDSFVTYCKKYGTEGKSLIIYNDAGAVLVIEEEKERGERETATLEFAYSDDWNHWCEVLKSPGMNHRDLLKHLLVHQHNLNDVKILDKMRTVKATMVVKQNSDLQLNNEEVGVVFTANGGDELVEFPRSFQVKLPVLDIDVEDEQEWVTIDVKVEVYLPRDTTGQVVFQLIAPKLLATRRKRVNAELEVISESLEKWTVVRGVRGETLRVVGRKPEQNALAWNEGKNR